MKIEEMTIVESTPVEAIKYCIVGLPDPGLVGLIAVSHIIHSLEMPEVGYVKSDLLPPVMVVHQGDPKPPLRVYGEEKFAAIISEIPINLAAIPRLARCIVGWVQSKGAELLVSVSGLAVQNRLDIETPAVFGVGTSSAERKLLGEASIPLLEEGFMVGPHALILRESMKERVPNVILLVQSHYQYPDPGAAASSIGTLNRLLGLDVDTKKLLEQAEEIRLKTRELMRRTHRSMQMMRKAQEQEIPPLYIG